MLLPTRTSILEGGAWSFEDFPSASAESSICVPSSPPAPQLLVQCWACDPFPSAQGGVEHKLVFTTGVCACTSACEGRCLFRFCQMQVELPAFVQVPKPFCSQAVALRLDGGAKEKAPLRGLHGYFDFLFPAPGGKPSLPPSHPPLKPTKQLTNPYLFVCLWLLPMLLIAPGPSLLFERAAV